MTETYRCYICKVPLSTDEDEVDFCYQCGEVICENCLRIPDPDEVPEEDLHDYCPACMGELGYSDIWDISYWNQFGDQCHVVLDVDPGTHPFTIKSIIRQRYGKPAGYTKRRF